MKIGVAALKKALKRKSDGAAPSGSSPKRARPSESAARPSRPPGSTSAPMPPPSVPSVPSPGEATGEGLSWSDDPAEEVAGAATAVAAAPPVPAAPPSAVDKGKAPCTGGPAPTRRTTSASGGEYVEVGISWADSGFDDPTVARRLLEVLRLSQDWEKTKARSIDEVGRESYRSLYKVFHEMSVLEKVATRSGARIAQLKKENARLKAGAAEAEKKLKAAEERLAAEMELLRTQLASAMSGLEESKTDAARLVEKSAKEMKKLRKKNRSLGRARDDAERRAEDAIRRAKDDVLLAGMRAVADYKASPEFEVEAADLGADSFKTGIDVTIGRVLRKYPNLDLADIESDDEDGAAPSAEATTEAPVEVVEVAEADVVPPPTSVAPGGHEKDLTEEGEAEVVELSPPRPVPSAEGRTEAEEASATAVEVHADSPAI